MAVDAFLEKKRIKGAAATTIENYEHRLWRLLDIPKNGDRPVRYVNGRGTELYLASAHGAGDTHINGLSVGRMWGEFCVKSKLLRASPFKDVETIGKRRKGSTKIKLRVDEMRKLLDVCLARTDINATLTLGYLLLGARASELVKRDVRDLDDGGKLLWIDRTKTEAGSRYLELPELLQTRLLALAEGKEPDAPLFVNLSGERMTRFVARDRVRAFCKDAKVPVVPPQALRRTLATFATEAGAMGAFVAAHLGHSSQAITNSAYIDQNVARAAKQGRAFKVIAGGLS